MLTVLSLAALMSTEHYLESQPQRRQKSSEFIDLFTVYYAAATQIQLGVCDIEKNYISIFFGIFFDNDN